MPDVCSGEVRRLVPVVIKDVVPVRERDDQRGTTDAAPVATGSIADGLAVRRQGAPVVDGCNIGLVADDSPRQ